MSELVYSLYIVEGGALFACNSLVGIATVFVMRRKSAFVLIGAMLAADAIFGLSYFLNAFYLLNISRNNQTDRLVPRAYCFALPGNILGLFAVPATAMMQFMVSLDRILAVFLPLQYLRLSAYYGIKMAGFVACLSLATVVYCAIFYTSADIMIPQKCTLWLTLGTTIRRILSAFRMFFSVASVVAYIPILWRLKKRLNQSAMLNGLNTFVLFNVPDIISFADPSNAIVPQSPLAMMLLGRCLVSTAIFVSRHDELRAATRRAVLQLLCRASLTTADIT